MQGCRLRSRASSSSSRGARTASVPGNSNRSSDRAGVERRAAHQDRRHAPRPRQSSTPARAQPWNSRHRGRLGHVEHVEQVVRDAAALRDRQLGGADVHAAVDLHRVGVDDLAAQRARPGRGTGRVLPAAVGPTTATTAGMSPIVSRLLGQWWRVIWQDGRRPTEEHAMGFLDKAKAQADQGGRPARRQDRRGRRQGRRGDRQARPTTSTPTRSTRAAQAKDALDKLDGKNDDISD